jgi:hypothetical protein
VITGKTYETIARWFFGVRLRDVDCDFRLIRAEYLRRIALGFDSGAIGVELVRRLQDAGCRMVEVPVHHYPRLYGRSEFFRWRHVAHLVSDLWRLHRTLRRERATGVRGRGTRVRDDGISPTEDAAAIRTISTDGHEASAHTDMLPGEARAAGPRPPTADPQPRAAERRP